MVWGWIDWTLRLNSDKRLDWLQKNSEHNGMRLDGLNTRLNSDKRLDWSQKYSDHNGMRLDVLNTEAEQWQEAGLAAEQTWTQWYEAGWTEHRGWTVTRGRTGCRTILNTIVWGWMDWTLRLNSDKRPDWLQNNSEHNSMRLDGLKRESYHWEWRRNLTQLCIRLHICNQFIANLIWSFLSFVTIFLTPCSIHNFNNRYLIIH